MAEITVEELMQERDALIAERDNLTTERDALIAERDNLTTERDALIAERDNLTTERDALKQSYEEKFGKGDPKPLDDEEEKKMLEHFKKIF